MEESPPGLFFWKKNSLYNGLNASKYQLGAEFWKEWGANILWLCHVHFLPFALVLFFSEHEREHQTLQNVLLNPDISQDYSYDYTWYLQSGKRKEKRLPFQFATGHRVKHDKWPGRMVTRRESLTLSTLPNSWALHPPPFWRGTGEQGFFWAFPSFKGNAVCQVPPWHCPHWSA